MVHDSECRVHYHCIDGLSFGNLQSQIIAALLDIVLYPSATLTLLERSDRLIEVTFLQ